LNKPHHYFQALKTVCYTGLRHQELYHCWSKLWCHLRCFTTRRFWQSILFVVADLEDEPIGEICYGTVSRR